MPCLISGQTHEHASAAIASEISSHFRSIETARCLAHDRAWAEATTPKEPKPGFEKADPEKPDPEKILLKYRKLARKYEAEYLPKPLWLIVTGDTGSGKTTLAQHLTASFDCTYVDLRSYSQSLPLQVLLNEAERVRRDRTTSTPRILVLDALDKMVPGAAHSVVVSNLRTIRAQAAGYAIVVITARTAFFRTHTDEDLGGKRISLQGLPVDIVFRLTADDGIGPEFQTAAQKSPRLIELAKKPLLYQLLLRLVRNGHDISKIEDDEDIFARLVDKWLSRDVPDALLASEVRMKCMQCLAIQALATGGAPVSYSSIDSLVLKVFGALTSKEQEQMNADLRVCGFLKRIADDLFEFEHAAFYEYCVARTAFHDLQHNDLTALEFQQFTDEVIEFIVRRAAKTGRRSEVERGIRHCWNKTMNSVACVNLLRLYTALEGQCGILDLGEMIIESQNLRGVKYRGGKDFCRNVVFRGCNFAGSDWGPIQAEGWLLDKCFVTACQFGFTRFVSARIVDTNWTIEQGNDIRFVNCDWIGSSIITNGGIADIQGGGLRQCFLASRPQLTGRQAVIASSLRLCNIERMSAGDSLDGWRIESCALDALSLRALSDVRSGQRPSLSKEIARAVTVWRNEGGSMFGIRMPASSASGAIEKQISGSKRRKIERKVRDKIRNERNQQKSGHTPD